MASFKVRGRFAGRQVEVTWSNGELGGDEAAIDVLKIVAKSFEGRTVTVPGLLEGNTDFLSNPFLTIRLLETEVLKGMRIVESDIEPIDDDIPDGAEI